MSLLGSTVDCSRCSSYQSTQSIYLEDSFFAAGVSDGVRGACAIIRAGGDLHWSDPRLASLQRVVWWTSPSALARSQRNTNEHQTCTAHSSRKRVRAAGQGRK